MGTGQQTRGPPLACTFPLACGWSARWGAGCCLAPGAHLPVTPSGELDTDQRLLRELPLAGALGQLRKWLPGTLGAPWGCAASLISSRSSEPRPL